MADIKSLGIEIVASVRDEYTHGVEAANAALERLSTHAQNVNKKISSIDPTKMDLLKQSLTNVGAVIPGVGGSLGALTNALKMLTNPVLGASAAFVGLTTGIAAFTISQANATHRMKLLGDQTGMTVSEINGLRVAGASSGLAVETTAAMVAKLETNLGNGSKKLREFGVTAKEPVEALGQVADAYKNAHSQAERAAIGNAAFGRGWREMVPLLEQGGATLKKTMQSAQIPDETMRNYEQIREVIRQMGVAWMSFKKEIASTASGPMAAALGSLESAGRELGIIGGKSHIVASIIKGISFDIYLVVEGLTSAAMIAKGALLVGFWAAGTAVAKIVQGISHVGLMLSKIVVSTTGKGQGLVEYFANSQRWAESLANTVSQKVTPGLQSFSNHFAGIGDRMRQAAGLDVVVNAAKKDSGGGDKDKGGKSPKGGAAKAVADTSAQELAARQAFLRAAHDVEMQAEVALEEDKTKAALKAEDERYSKQTASMRDQYSKLKGAGKEEAAALNRALEAEEKMHAAKVAKINRDAEAASYAERERMQRDYLKRFSAAARKNAETQQALLKNQETAYDRTYGKMVGVATSSMGTIITTQGSAESRLKAGVEALYSNAANEIAQYTEEFIASTIKREALHEATQKAAAAASLAASAEAVASGEVTGAALADAYSTAAAFASVASWGAADVAGGAALAANVAQAKSLSAFAAGGFMQSASIVGERGAEVYSPTVPGRVTQTSNSTVNNYSSGGMTVYTTASVSSIATALKRSQLQQRRTLNARSHN